jgi:hypothetical protein
VANNRAGRAYPGPAHTDTDRVAGADDNITVRRGGPDQGHRWILRVPRRRGARELWLTDAELADVVAEGLRALTGGATEPLDAFRAAVLTGAQR